ncbi:MAG TPA: BatD family protein [Kiritimatiellia bacterium]|nr:BatD family protein [Kiritimatiellia bacterium]
MIKLLSGRAIRPGEPFFLVALAIALLLPPTAAHAAEVELDVNPKVLRLGESTLCRIIVRDAQNAPAPRLPQLNGFEVRGAGQETSIRIENGQQSAYTAYRFHLIPQAAGDFQIGPFRYDYNGRVIDLPAVQVQVLPAQDAGANANAQELDELVFASLTATRPHVYVQEIFELTLQLYIRTGINLDRNVSLLDFDTLGLSLTGFEELASTRESVNGQIYDVRRFRTRASALTAGTFDLKPRLRVNIIVPQRRERMRDPFFGDGFFDGFFNRVETRAHTVDTKPLALRVLDLPAEGRPSSFAGAVGRFSFDVTAAPLDTRVGEPITLTLRIQGRGNLDAVGAPAIALPDSFRSYDARLIEQNPNTGLKVFEKVLIPRSTANTEIPALSFSYFDPERERYETIVRGPFPLTLAEAPAGSSFTVQTPGAPAPKLNRDPLGTDLVYLQPAPARWRRADAASSPLAALPPALHVAPVLALLLAVGFARRRERLARDPRLARRREAPRGARAGLAQLRAHLQAGRHTEAAHALADLLARFYGNLLNLAPGQVTPDEVCPRLRAGGMPDAEVAAVRDLFARCEELRYARPAESTASEAAKTIEAQLDRIATLLRASERAAR